MAVTDDPHDLRLYERENGEQNEVYLVLSEEERAKGFIRPYRNSYIHGYCGVLTRMNQAISETYARDPKFYGLTWCMSCKKHLPVSEFTWDKDGLVVGS